MFPILKEFCRGQRRDAPGYFIQHLMERGERVKAFVFEGEWYDISHKTYWQVFRDAKLSRSDEICVQVSKNLGTLELALTILKSRKSVKLRPFSVHVVVEGTAESLIEGRSRTVKERDVIVAGPSGGTIDNKSELEVVFLSIYPKKSTICLKKR